MAEHSPSCAVRMAMNSLLGHQKMTKEGAAQDHKQQISNCSVRLAQVTEQQAAQGRLRSTRRTTPVVDLLVCSKQLWRGFESAGDAFLLRLRPANLRWSHCSKCQVWSVVFNVMVAGTTLMDPWRMINHWFCDAGSTTKPQHSSHMQPWGSQPGPHSGVTPEVGYGTLVWLKAASSGEIRRWSVESA